NSLQTVIYRPMNRAVFKAHLAPQQPAGLGETIYLKVLRPNTAAALYNIHLKLSAAGVPVVAPIAEPVADVLALAGGQGIPLGELVRIEGVHNHFDPRRLIGILEDRKSTRLNSSHVSISSAVFCLKKKIE